MSGTPRADLLALTPDDLATLTNRGTVKRAQKEIEAGEPTVEIEEDGGDLVFRWSDGNTCRFPGGRPVQDASCSSGLAGISRHIVRSILAYQKAAAGAAPPSEPPTTQTREGASAEAAAAEAAPPPASIAPAWDPGAITDDELIAHFRKPAIQKARRRFEQGVLVELTRGSKPVARFLDENCTVRFLVPGSLHYISGDCSEAALPLWVPMAVWAFRELPPRRLAGLVSLRSSPLPVPRAGLEALDALIDELYRDGLDGVAESWPHRLSRVEEALRVEGLTWPAELVADLLHQVEMYRGHDARFEPSEVIQILGELTARGRAILGETGAVPQPLIRGTMSDRPAEISGGRLIGVGLGVRAGRKHTTISAYLQDADSGGLVAVERTHADPEPPDAPRSFAALATSPLSRGVSLAGLAASNLLLKSGKRTPSGLLHLPRTAGSLASHPQAFRWEELKPPFAAEGFAQLAERFEALPPSALRPRRRTENLHAVPVERAEDVGFDPALQRLTARLVDAEGRPATLVLPYHQRGREGFEGLAALLGSRGDRVRFVSGRVRSVAGALEIEPTALVVEDGPRRIGVLPWLPAHAGDPEAGPPPRIEPAAEADAQGTSHINEFLARLDDLLSDLVLTGVARAEAAAWSELDGVARRAGFVRLAAPIGGLAGTLGGRADSLRWDPSRALRFARELCLLARLASD